MTERPLCLMFVDHAAVEASRRVVYRILAQNPGWHVHVVTPATWNEGGNSVVCEPETDPGVHVHVSSVLFGRRTHRIVYLRLPSLVRTIRPDFLSMDAEPENYAALEALVLRRLLIPGSGLGLVSSRNIDHHKVGFPYKLSFTHRFCDVVARRWKADVLFCRPTATQTFAAPYAAKVCYLPHAVDCSVFSPLPEESTRLREILTVGFVGRITVSKGIRVLLQAFGQLGTRHRLVLVGKGGLVGETRETVQRLGIADRVTVCPPVPYSGIPDIMRGFDVLVLPSLETRHWKEQFGRVLIEAMASGVPVVASDSGGIPDVVGDAGVLFRTGSVPELARELSGLLSSRERRETLRRKGRERVLRLFDCHVIARVLAEEIAGALTPAGAVESHGGFG